jgi:hypothetical protein
MKTKYSFKIYLTLAFVSSCLLLANISSNVEIFFAAGELIAGLAGFYVLLGSYRTFGETFSFSRVLGASSLLVTAWGTSNTYLRSSFISKNWEDYLASMGLATEHVAWAQLAVLLYSTTLILLPHVSKALFGAKESATRPPELSKAMVRFAIAVSLLQLYAMMTGAYTYRGIFTDVQEVDPLITLLSTLAPAVVMICGMLLTGQHATKLLSLKNAILVFLFSIQGIWFFASGRREILYGIGILIFGMAVGSRYSDIKRKFRPVTVLLSFGFVALMWNLFYLIRVLSYTDTSIADSNIFNILARAIPMLLSGATVSIGSLSFAESLDLNMATRTFVLSYFADLVRHMPDYAPLMGQDLISNALNAIPRAIYGAKSDLMLSETLYSTHFGLPSTDNADSYFLSAFADFSWLGLIAYPLILYAIYSVIFTLARKARFDVLTIIIIAGFLRLGFSGGESSLTTYFVEARNLLFFFLLFSILGLFKSENPPAETPHETPDHLQLRA